MRRPTIVISGSFRKHFAGIQEQIREFEALGIDVLSPKLSNVVNPDEEFAILESDDTSDPQVLEQRHLDAIESADALYLFNPQGYIGASATMELGWALALGKPIYSAEPASDFTLKLFSGVSATSTQVRDRLLEMDRHFVETINDRSSVKTLQRYIQETVERRGFDKETPVEIMLLLVEEIGELAKALRKFMGLKVNSAKADKYTQLQDELADVFIYLLDLANVLEISLFKALHDKERENEKRFWDKAL